MYLSFAIFQIRLPIHEGQTSPGPNRVLCLKLYIFKEKMSNLSEESFYKIDADQDQNSTYQDQFTAINNQILINQENIHPYSPLLCGWVWSLHNGMIMLILWINYRLQRAILKAFKNMGPRHINSIIIPSMISTGCNSELCRLSFS